MVRSYFVYVFPDYKIITVQFGEGFALCGNSERHRELEGLPEKYLWCPYCRGVTSGLEAAEITVRDIWKYCGDAIPGQAYDLPGFELIPGVAIQVDESSVIYLGEGKTRLVPERSATMSVGLEPGVVALNSPPPP
ncbi:MAG: hypothetical protein WDN04_14295 [Rhodospirillales bacterium]